MIRNQRIATTISTISVLLFSVPRVSQADTANVTIYGALNVSLENVEVQNSPTGEYPDRFRLVSNGSSFGLKGWEDLGGDFKFIWQLESNLLLQSANGSVLGARNSFVGVGGKYGTLQIGFFDTPFKSLGQVIEPYYLSGVGLLGGMLGTPGGSAGTVSVTSGGTNGSSSPNASLSFDRRQGNAIQYISPAFMGVTARLFYSTALDRSTTLANPSMWSGSIAYDDSTLIAGYSIERHDDFKGSFTSTTAAPTAAAAAAAAASTTADWGHKVMAAYRFSEQTFVGAAYTFLSYASKDAALNETDLSRSAIGLSVLQKFSDFTLRLGAVKAFNQSFGPAAAAVNVDGTGAYLFDIGGSYSMSKRSDIYLLVARVQNDFLGTYNFGLNGIGGGGFVTPGTYPTSVGIGLRHVF